MKDKVRNLIAEQLCISVDKVTDEADITKDLGADSLDMIEMLMSLEENFGISVPDDKVASLKTVNDIVAFIQAEKKDAE